MMRPLVSDFSPLIEKQIGISARLRPLEEKDCAFVTRMHNNNIPAGTMNTLGNEFTELIFRALAVSRSGFCLLAEDNGHIIGIIAGTVNMKGFYREFFSRYPFKASWLLLRKLFNPAVFMKIYRLSLYPWNFPYISNAEGISFAVAPEYRKTGLTFLLWQKKAEAFKSLGVDRVRICIHSTLVNNQRFFERLGLKFQGEVQFTKNEGMKVYLWDLNSFDSGITTSKP